MLRTTVTRAIRSALRLYVKIDIGVMETSRELMYVVAR